jgi:hypothetical protein
LTSGILSDTLEVKGDKMKYVFRRALVGVVIVPLVAVAWFVFYAMLVGLGADPTNTPQGVFNDGLFIGLVVESFFVGDAVVKVVRK